jgi:hypothetical protein
VYHQDTASLVDTLELALDAQVVLELDDHLLPGERLEYAENKLGYKLLSER